MLLGDDIELGGLFTGISRLRTRRARRALYGYLKTSKSSFVLQGLTYDQLDAFPYVEAVFNESMRLFPPGAVNDRLVSTPIKV